MNAATKCSLPPSLTNFMVTADAKEQGKIGWVHTTFAYNLFVAAKGLRANAPSARITIEAARTTVGMWKRKAEAGWTSKGETVAWSDADYENIAVEMAETLSRHPWVVTVVERHLETWRDKVFSDASLTRNNELFVVYSFSNNKTNFETFSVKINETPIETINRSLDYIETMIKSGSGQNFIQLYRILTLLAKIHDIVIAA